MYGLMGQDDTTSPFEGSEDAQTLHSIVYLLQTPPQQRTQQLDALNELYEWIGSVKYVHDHILTNFVRMEVCRHLELVKFTKGEDIVRKG
eukprot:COSAG05_NODE_21955_length_268_cov_0.609467_1_plen_89_part_11